MYRCQFVPSIHYQYFPATMNKTFLLFLCKNKLTSPYRSQIRNPKDKHFCVHYTILSF